MKSENVSKEYQKVYQYAHDTEWFGNCEEPFDINYASVYLEEEGIDYFTIKEIAAQAESDTGVPMQVCLKAIKDYLKETFGYEVDVPDN